LGCDAYIFLKISRPIPIQFASQIVKVSNNEDEDKKFPSRFSFLAFGLV